MQKIKKCPERQFFCVQWHLWHTSQTQMSVSVCPGCASYCAVCCASGASHNGVHACKDCRKSNDFGHKCPVCRKRRGDSTMGRLCSKCARKHDINCCDYCGDKLY